MSELKVDRIEPALANKITLSPSVYFENATGVVKFLVDSTSVTVTGPLKVGTIIGDVNTGTSRQILTSQGASLPPIWTDNFPIGGIIMWSGNQATVPNGWAICNGGTVNGIATPNLVDKFVVGAGSSYSVGNSGGSPNAVVVSHTHALTDPGHGHFFVMDDNLSGLSNSNLGGKIGLQRLDKLSGGGADGGGDLHLYSTSNTDKTNITIASASSDTGTNKNLPPYYALYYIMKVS